MKRHLLDYRYTYHAEYFRWKGRIKQHAYLTGIQPVAIAEVEPADAPVAYRVLSSEPDFRPSYEVRAFDGSLWWPINSYGNPLEPAAFLALAASNWERASRVLDPMHRTYYVDGIPIEEFLAETRVSKGRFVSDREQQAKQAERDASKVIFCGDRVLVDAGDPVWYAVLDEDARCFNLSIGHSDLDRVCLDQKYGVGFFTPGPDRGVRIRCGRLSQAFGLDEMSFALQTIADLNCAFRIDSEIVPLSARVPGPAAELCVRASAQHLRNIAGWRPDLRRAMPELERASAKTRSDFDSDALMLRHLVGRPDPVLRNAHAQLVAEARQVLDRLDSLQPLAEEDEAALSMLGI
jgi:hypothetical protein